MHILGALCAILFLSSTAMADSATLLKGRRSLQQAASFPPLCKCDRDPSHSSYYMTMATPQPRTTCFTVQNDSPCDPKLKCCRTAMSKVEFKVGEWTGLEQQRNATQPVGSTCKQ